MVSRSAGRRGSSTLGLPGLAGALRRRAVLRDPHRRGLRSVLPAPGRDAVPGQHRADRHRRRDRAPARAATADSILGQAPQVHGSSRRNPPGSPSRPSTASSVDLPFFKHTFVFRPAPRRRSRAGCSGGCRSASCRRGGADSPASSSSSPPCSSRAKLLGELAERIGQPAVLGELVAGVLLGGSVLGSCPPTVLPAELVHVLAELGVLLLLFEIGLETDLREMFRVGPAVAGRGRRRRRACRSPSATLYWALRCRTRRSASGDLATAGDLHRRDPHRDLGRHHRPGALATWAGCARRRPASSSAPRSSTTCSASSS